MRESSSRGSAPGPSGRSGMVGPPAQRTADAVAELLPEPADGAMQGVDPHVQSRGDLGAGDAGIIVEVDERPALGGELLEAVPQRVDLLIVPGRLRPLLG